MGERVQLLLSDVGFSITNKFQVSNAVNTITPLVEKILMRSQEHQEMEKNIEIYIFHNQPKSGSGYVPIMQGLLPLDKKWMNKSKC